MLLEIPSTVTRLRRGSSGTAGFAGRAFVGTIGCRNNMGGESQASDRISIYGIMGPDADMVARSTSIV
jgi:hypothetical protein